MIQREARALAGAGRQLFLPSAEYRIQPLSSLF